MKKWIKRIRAAIGMGLTWAAAWFGAGMLLLLVVGFDAADVPFPLFFGLLGFLAGATFSGILGILGRRRRFDEMSLGRFAGLGALGGLIVSGIVSLAAGPGADFLTVGLVFALAGAISAAGTLVLARRAEQPKSLSFDAEAAESPLESAEIRSFNRSD
jgi:FtsH-binding integral membrane protein